MQFPLRVNDMSLPAGGKFSTDSNWDNRKHKFHRVGRDVDVRAQYEDIERPGIFIEWVKREDQEEQTVWVRRNLDFEDLVDGLGARAAVHSPIKRNFDGELHPEQYFEHYHIYFY